jgi:ABC-type glycerol-3-phosphate transport system permease component
MSAVTVPAERRRASLRIDRSSVTRALGTVVLVVLAALYVLPLIWLLSISVRVQSDVFRSVLIPGSFEPSNYTAAWDKFGLDVLFLNSILVTVGTVVIGVGLSVSAAYGFSRFKSRWSEVLYLLILIGLMVPPAAIIIPFFLGMLNLGLYDSLVAVIVGETSFVLAFGILVFRGYIDHIPKELLDAGRVDGASEGTIFRRIVLPLLRPPLATVAIFFALSTWNGFLLPLVLIRDTDRSTLTVGMSRYTGQFGTQDWNLLAAAAVMAILPLLIFFIGARRSYVRGLSAGAIKS